MRRKRLLLAAPVALACVALVMTQAAEAKRSRGHGPGPGFSFDQIIRQHSTSMLDEGRQTFRYDTFGDEAFWGGTLQLHRAIEGAALGGVGPGVSPKTALAVGLKVDVDALAPATRDAIEAGQVNLDDPAVTVELLKENAVVGLTGVAGGNGGLQTIGIQCALCHSTVDNSLAPGIGHRLDGWANRDLNVGQIVALAPNLQPIADLLGTDVATVRRVLLAWGPGKFDAELFLDGKGFRPDGKTAAVLIPPAFGLAGVNLHTWTGWGSVTYWNAFVANLEMHGEGTFFDPRLDDAAQFPIAAAHHFGHVTSDDDRITPKLPALHYYQLAIPAPKPPPGSFDEAAAARGDELFGGKAKCVTCHTDELYSEPGWNLHRGDEIGIDNFQADRAPDHRYRTSPLKGLWTHQKGGFFHDGRFPTLLAVVDHYNTFFNLGLSDSEKHDLVEYLKSLSDDVPPSTMVDTTVTIQLQPSHDAPRWRLSASPTPAQRGAAVRLELAGMTPENAPSDLIVHVFDVQGRQVAAFDRSRLSFAREGAALSWDGTMRPGSSIAAGVYFVRAEAPSAAYREERKVVLR
jgi:cytochrome c5